MRTTLLSLFFSCLLVGLGIPLSGLLAYPTDTSTEAHYPNSERTKTDFKTTESDEALSSVMMDSEYCAVTSTSTTYGIGYFTTSGGFTNIDNASGPGSYSDFTDQSASTYAGGSISFAIYSANSTAGMGVWVDWNNDFDFDDTGEHVYNSASYLDIGQGTITVPVGTPNGSYTMRIVANYMSQNPTPCGDLGYSGAYGEAEDYTFIVSDPPACPPVITLTAELFQTSVTLEWTELSTPSGGYEYIITTSNQEPGEDEEGTFVTGTSVTVDDLAPDYTYYAFVRANCDDDGNSSWVSTSFFVGYCQVNSTNTNYGISNFSTTGGYTNINNSTGPGTYSNYSAYIVTTSAEGTVNFSITSANSTAGMAIWVDWNNDFDFSDAGEQVYMSAAYVASATGTITVPAGVGNGSYRMRVVANYLSSSPTSCGDLGYAAYGEAEDYTFMVSDEPSCMPVTNLVAQFNMTSVTLEWTESSGNPAGEYEYVISTSNQLPGEDAETTTVTGTTVTIDDMAPDQAYYAFVRAICDDDDVSFWAVTSFYVGYCEVTSTSTTYGIGNFTTTGGFLNINNTTGAGSYSNYSDQIVSTYAGGNVSFSMTGFGGTYTYGMRIWVDWNADYIFDATELVYSSGTSYVGSASGTITVPVGTPNGSYRMRAVANYLSTSPTACGNLGNAAYGEAEDYTFMVSDPPECPPVITLTAELNQTSVTLEWTELSSPSGGYEYVISTTNAVPTEEGNFVSGTTVTVDDLEVDQTYYAYVRAICDGGETSLWVSTSFLVGYCEVTSTSTTYGISYFGTTEGFTNIDNASGPGSYSNYTEQSVSIYPGGSVDFTITSAFGTTGMGIWVDWNNNFSFDDPGEHVFSSGSNYVSSSSGSITVPANTPIGSYRMRVVANYLSTSPIPCGALGSAANGEAEDYTFIVSDPPECAPVVGLTAQLNQTTAVVEWFELGTPPGGYEYFLLTENVEPTEEGSFTMGNTVTFEDLEPGETYYVYVRAICAGGELTDWTIISFHVGYCEVTSTNTLYGVGNFTTTGGFLNINNTTGAGTYSDYTTQAVSTIPGGSVNFTITGYGSSYTYGLGLWIDWNDDYDFSDPGEQILLSGSYVSSASGTITVPAQVGPGSYRIRVVANYLSTSPTSCGNLGNVGYGEAEDYTFIVSDPPSCYPVTTLSSDVSGTSVTLNWTETETPEVGYEYVISTTNTLPDENGTSVTGLSVTVDDLIPGTTYYAFVRADCGEEDGYSYWVTTSFYVGYCVVTSTNSTYGISNFTTTGGFANINNTSGPSAYSDFSSQFVAIDEGSSFNFTATSLGTYTHGFGIWVDWNNDMDFSDPGEQVYMSGSYVAMASGSITVPAGTPNGTYRMRVVANYLSTSPTACGNLGNASYGEAEDYSVLVTGAPTCPTPLALTADLFETTVTLNWLAPEVGLDDYEYIISTSSALPTGNGTSVSGTTVTIDDLDIDMTYYVFVRTDCGEEDGYSFWTSVSFHVGYCEVTSTSTNYGISNFTTTGGFTNINNTTGPGSYSNYSYMVVSTYAQGSVNFSITGAGTGNTYGMGIWIDWNNDFDFNDPGEQIYMSGAYVSNAAGTITVPAGIENGSYRMRVVANWLSTSPVPCGDLGNGTYGEAEDYTFMVADPPACPPVITLTAQLNATTVILSWTELSSPSDGYQYVISTSNTQPTEDGTSVEGLTVTVDDLEPGTTYYAFVRANCGEDGYSFWVSTSFYVGYCEVTSTSTTYGISNFSTTNGFENINNSTTGGSYSDFTDQVVSTYAGGNVSFSITSANSTAGMGIWIDWNNDFDFDDPGELVFSSGAYVSSATGTINAPVGTPLGSYRMRVVANYSSLSPTPCGTLGNAAYGEAEDYTFAVVETPDCAPPANLLAGATSTSTADVSWIALNEGVNDFQYYLSTNPDAPGDDAELIDVTGTSFELTDMEAGTYYVYVRASCGDDEYSSWTGPGVINLTEGDEPCTAFELPISGECVYQTYSNAGMTNSANPNIPAPGCAGYQTGDMWFTVQVPANGHVIVDAIQGSLTDCGMAWYIGDDCNGELTLLECDDDDSPNGLMPMIEMEGLDPFTTLYIRFWKYGTYTSGTFGICASTPCTAPGNPTLTTEGNTATATWASAGEGAIYNWEVRLSGAAGSGEEGLVQSGVTDQDVTSIVITGLDYATTYQFFVSTNCGDGVTSAWSSVVLFTTEVMQGCTDPTACNYNEEAMIDDGSCEYVTTTLFEDADGDGYGNPDVSIENCGINLPGYVTNSNDCDDTDASVWLSGSLYIDADGDGYDAGSETVCYGDEIPEGYSESSLGNDCDDNDPDSWGPSDIAVTVTLPVTEICYNSAGFTLTGGSPAGGTWTGQGVNNGQFNPAGLAYPAEYTITYTVAGDGICSSGGSATATIQVKDCIGVDEYDPYQITLYPTYTNSSVTVRGLDLTEAIIMDMNGKRLNNISLNTQSVIDMQSYPTGVYFIHILSKKNSKTFKVVKVN